MIFDTFNETINSALVMIVALAWNQAIRRVIDKTRLVTLGPLIYAMAMTAILIVYVIAMNKIRKKIASDDENM